MSERVKDFDFWIGIAKEEMISGKETLALEALKAAGYCVSLYFYERRTEGEQEKESGTLLPIHHLLSPIPATERSEGSC